MNGKLTDIQRRYLNRLGRGQVEQPTLSGDLLSDLVHGWTEYTTERLKQSLLNSKSPRNPTSGRASGSLLASLDAAKTRKMGNTVIGRINANDYYINVDQGQDPGVPIGPLYQALQGPYGWISAKKIKVRQSASESKQTVAQRNKSLAYAIAKKINRDGTVGNQFFSKVINQQTFDEFSEYLGQAMGQQIATSFQILSQNKDR
jgi:hypothetical protein